MRSLKKLLTVLFLTCCALAVSACGGLTDCSGSGDTSTESSEVSSELEGSSSFDEEISSSEDEASSDGEESVPEDSSSEEISTLDEDISSEIPEDSSSEDESAPEDSSSEEESTLDEDISSEIPEDSSSEDESIPEDSSSEDESVSEDSSSEEESTPDEDISSEDESIPEDSSSGEESAPEDSSSEEESTPDEDISSEIPEDSSSEDESVPEDSSDDFGDDSSSSEDSSSDIEHIHTWEGIETTPPTCTEMGYTTYYCEGCGNTYIGNYVGVKGHDYQITEYVDATCTQNGHILFACSGCGGTKTQDITSTGHEFGYDNVCDNCGYTVSVHQHSYTQTTVDPTCTEMGYTQHSCNHCEYAYKTDFIEALGHKYNDGTVVTDKTCTQNGEMKYECERCGKSYTEEIPAGHNWAETTVTEATCTADGEKSKICLDCGAKEREVIPAGHKWEEKSVIKQPTCKEAGESAYECSVCGATKTDTVGELGHHFVNGICQRCGEGYMDSVTEYANHPEYGMYFEVDEIVSAYGPIPIDEYGVYLHYNAGANIEKVAVYLTQEGTMWRRCIACTGTGIEYATYVPYLSSDGDMKYTGLNSDMINIFPLKKNADGIWCYSNYATIGVNLADKNGDLLLSLYDIGQAGAKTKLFDNLNEMIAWLKNECAAHDYQVKETFAPTCTEKGYTVYECTECGSMYTGDYVDVISHDYEATVTKEPGCWVGEKTHTCSVCGDSYTEDIPATEEHEPVYGESICFVTCGKCGETLSNEHGESVFLPVDGGSSICTEEHMVAETCSVCQMVIKIHRTAPIGHKYAFENYSWDSSKNTYVVGLACEECAILIFTDAWKNTENSKEATCSEEGYDIYSYEYEYSDGKQPQLHVADIPEKLNVRPSTGRHEITDGTTTVFVQNGGQYEYNDDFETLLESGVIVWNEGMPTCDSYGMAVAECDVCEDTAIFYLSGKHSYGEEVAPTCLEDGYQACQSCGIKNATDLAQGHSWSFESLDEVNATMTVECEACGATETGLYKEHYYKGNDCRDQSYTEYVIIIGNGLPADHSNFQDDKITYKKYWYNQYVHTFTDGTTTIYAQNMGRYEYNDKFDALLASNVLRWTEGEPNSCNEYRMIGGDCSVCNYLVVFELSGKHNYGETYTVEPTCLNRGMIIKECLDCMADVEMEAMPALGHYYKPETNSYNEFILNPQQGGRLDFYCEACGEVISLNAIMITAVNQQECVVITYTYYEFEHTYQVEAETAGVSVNKVFHFEYRTQKSIGTHKIGDVQIREGEIYEYNGQFQELFDSGLIRWLEGESACNEYKMVGGDCSVCGYLIVFQLSGAHALGDIKTEEATCTQYGYKYAICEDCGGKILIEELEALGHDLTWEIIGANASNPGYASVMCTRCDVTYEIAGSEKERVEPANGENGYVIYEYYDENEPWSQWIEDVKITLYPTCDGAHTFTDER